MLTIKDLLIFSTDSDSGLCVFNFTKPVLFINCTFDECAKSYVDNHPHLFAVI